jgi:hypothetical protein
LKEAVRLRKIMLKQQQQQTRLHALQRRVMFSTSTQQVLASSFSTSHAASFSQQLEANHRAMLMASALIVLVSTPTNSFFLLGFRSRLVGRILHESAQSVRALPPPPPASACIDEG